MAIEAAVTGFLPLLLLIISSGWPEAASVHQCLDEPRLITLWLQALPSTDGFELWKCQRIPELALLIPRGPLRWKVRLGCKGRISVILSAAAEPGPIGSQEAVISNQRLDELIPEVRACV